ncbi:NmrA family NAD(P)-binding protein [Rhodococcus sp. NPDC003348]
MTQTQTVTVTGATGAQGGAVVDALLAAGTPVRALVRDISSPRARALCTRGVELASGDFDDPLSLRAAVEGSFGVFSMQTPAQPGDPGGEERAAANLVQAATSAGVEVFVHTSVARAGDHDSFVGWDQDRWWPTYWLGKAAANEQVRSSSLARWTILKPAFMMDNFLPPKAAKMYPQLSEGSIVTALRPDTRVDLIAAADIGRVAAAAFADPARFDRLEIDLAAESLTMSEIAATLTRVTGTSVRARHLDMDAVVAAGTHPGVAENQLWASVEGYRVDLDAAGRHGVGLQRFTDWALEHRQDFALDGDITGDVPHSA